MKRKTVGQLASGLLTLLAALLLAGCGTQARVTEAIQNVPLPDNDNCFNRQQIAWSEEINDNPNKIMFWYILSNDGHLLAQFTCVGRPASSTESLEPNDSTSGNGSWPVPLQGGQTGYTTEMMGMDGTFGEEMPYRFCISPEHHYQDVVGGISIVTDTPQTFPAPAAGVDEELEAKKLTAEQALKDGKCVDSALNVIACSKEDNSDILLPNSTPTAEAH